MAEQSPAPASEPKRRGVGFPQMSLGQAVDAIITIGQNGGDHTHDAASAYLGHATANSGAFRNKLAALRDWGLLARGDRNRVVLSGLAQELVLEGPEHHLILNAFDSCAVFKKLYEDSAKNTPLDEQRLRTVVVMRHGVANDQADRFVSSFVDSVTYAGLGTLDGGRLTLTPRDSASQPGETKEPEKGPSDAVPQSNSLSPASVGEANDWDEEPVRFSSSAPVALRQTWPIDGGEIEFTIRTGKAMPPGIYALMAEMATVASGMEKLLRLEVPYSSSIGSTSGTNPSVPSDTK